ISPGGRMLGPRFGAGTRDAAAARAAAMVTAPSPGSPTPLEAGPPRPPPPPPVPLGGYAAEVARAMFAVRPPGQPGDPAGGAGSGKRLCHSIRDRSVSTA